LPPSRLSGPETELAGLSQLSIEYNAGALGKAK